jgi:hypothetical protein
MDIRINLSLVENFYSPEDLEYRGSKLPSTCMKRNLPETKQNLGPFLLHYGQVKLWQKPQ